MGHQIKAYSLKLAFSKEYVKKIEKLYPELDIGKPQLLLFIYFLILPICEAHQKSNLNSD
jgi:hypothetical protein